MEGSVRRESDDQSGLRLSPSYLKRCVCVYVCVCVCVCASECMCVSRVRRQLLMTIWRRVEKKKKRGNAGRGWK